jgi:two-component system chemotaxis sensor kinase CheA
VAKDPYRYFRAEAREILEGLGSGVLLLERDPTPELVQRLLRLAHTLKGAARVVKQPKIAEHTHTIEEALAPLRDPGGKITRERVDRVLALLDAIAELVAALDGESPREAPPPAVPRDAEVRRDAAAKQDPAALSHTTIPRDAAVQPRAPVVEPARIVRAELAEMDALLEGVAEASVQLRSMRQAIGVLERARHLADLLVEQLAPSLARDLPRAEVGVPSRARSLADELRGLVTRLERTLPNSLEQVERETRQVRDAAERLLLVPASSVFASLERTTRDAALALGKQAVFEATGGRIRLDAHVLGAVESALVQVARNAVAHGIEAPAGRATAGKTPMGRIALSIVRRGNRVAFVCRDDGAGVNLDAVRRVAEKRGLVAAGASKLDAEKLLRLLLEGGITTAGSVTEVAGRGIGLDLVREVAVRLGGEATVRTEAGCGTTVELVVPVSLSSVDALLVEAGGIVAAIPLDAVRVTRRLASRDVARSANGDTIVHDGAVLSFMPLARLLRAKTWSSPTTGTFSALVVGSRTSTALAAIGVDRLLGTANVVMRPLPPLAPAEPIVAGASLDAEGKPQLVLDPERLVLEATTADRDPLPAPLAAPPPILIIDDSLTTRMLEKSILESAGYEVELAISAEEGLEKAQRRRYRLFLVDVEMPGMDGFTFVERTRADPLFRDIPAILVTSLNSPEDRARGSAVGASDYIVKGEFDQGRLLETIRTLLG